MFQQENWKSPNLLADRRRSSAKPTQYAWDHRLQAAACIFLLFFLVLYATWPHQRNRQGRELGLNINWLSQGLSVRTVIAISCFAFSNTLLLEISLVLLLICHNSSGKASQAVRPSLELFIIQTSQEFCAGRNRSMNTEGEIKVVESGKGADDGRVKRRVETTNREKLKQKHLDTCSQTNTQRHSEFSTCCSLCLQ